MDETNLKLRLSEYCELGFCLVTENEEYMIQISHGELQLFFTNPDYDGDPEGTYCWTGDTFYKLDDVIEEINNSDLKYLQIDYNKESRRINPKK